MAQQTAVKQLIEDFDFEFKTYCISVNWEIFIEIEKEQIIHAYNRGYRDGEIDSLDLKHEDVQFFEDAEKYYKETYGTE